MVAADKPAGLFVHRTNLDRTQPALLQAVRDAIGERVYPVHRIDRAASGIVLFARSREAAAAFQAALSGAEKIYLGFGRGVAAEHAVLDRALSHPKTKEPRAARTELWRLAILEGCSLLRLSITTGRHHQIRRHLAHAAHHLLGDTKYGKGRINARFRVEFGLPRMALHAWHLELAHPMTGDLLHIEAPVADDLRAFFERLPGWDPAVL